MGKLKIAFNPSEVWHNDLFREFIKTLVYDVDNYEVFLITTDTDSQFITNVYTEANIDVANVSQLTTNISVVARLNTLGVLIYFAEDNILVNLVNNTLPLQLTNNNVTGCQALVLNNIMDTYMSQMKYITLFDFWQKQIEKQY